MINKGNLPNLPVIPQDVQDMIAGLWKTEITKDDYVPLGALFSNDLEEIKKHPVLFHVKFFERLSLKVAKEIWPCMVLYWSKSLSSSKEFGGDLYINYSPIEGYPVRKLDIKRNKFIYEQVTDYAKRLHAWCVENKLNIMVRDDKGIGSEVITFY